MRLVIFGDGQSPHLLKWARALAVQPGVELWAASSRGFLAGFDELLPASRRLALGARARHAGGNLGVLWHLPRLVRWLRGVAPDWVHAHYLTSHGALALLAQRFFGVPGRLAGSAWGSDILVTPSRGPVWRGLTRRILAACALTTSDSQHMATRMRDLGAGEVMVFPFGLEALPQVSTAKDEGLWFTNRGLEPLYRPDRVLRLFAAISRPQDRLVVANDGSLRSDLQSLAAGLGIRDRVQFTGLLSEAEQARWYERARWYLSLPGSDSVSVSVLEAMAHGCIPVLSDLPANRELVRDGENGCIVAADEDPSPQSLDPLRARADAIARINREWVAAHGLFAPHVAAFVQRLRAISGAA